MGAFSIKKPENPLPIIFDSPHSGCVYPDDFKYACTHDELRRTEDSYIDDLFSAAPNHGASLLLAHFPRCYIDVNRAIDDIDLALIEGNIWPYGEINPTARSDAGIGLIRRLSRPGRPIYNRALSPQEIQNRIETYYKPYHRALERLIANAHYNYGQVWHINCHSMPDASSKPRMPIGFVGHTPESADIVLGDRDSTTCDFEFTRAVRDFLRGLDYRVTLNDPFKGVELVRRYSNPASGRNSLQIEINKSLYMDETTGKKSKHYEATKHNMGLLIQFCADYAQSNLQSLAAD